MPPASSQPLRCALLLAAAVAWLVSVTLCSTRVLAEVPHEHPFMAGQADHDHDHDGQQSDGGCSCESFKAFPAQTAAALLKAPIPTILLRHTIPVIEFAYESAGIAVTTQNTGPPGRITLADLVLERCRLNHAPPLVV